MAQAVLILDYWRLRALAAPRRTYSSITAMIHDTYYGKTEVTVEDAPKICWNLSLFTTLQQTLAAAPSCSVLWRHHHCCDVPINIRCFLGLYVHSRRLCSSFIKSPRGTSARSAIPAARVHSRLSRRPIQRWKKLWCVAGKC